MRIRSITVFCSPEDRFGKASQIVVAAKAALIELGYEVQTTRAALPPVREWCKPGGLIPSAKLLEAAAREAGIDYLSIGPIDIEQLEFLPKLFAETQAVFTTAFVADTSGNIFGDAIASVAKAIVNVAKSPPTGFSNLRFAALANCADGIPFFPAAYAKTGSTSFALAMESADLALNACTGAGSHGEAMARLQSSIEEHARRIEPAMEAVAKSSGVAFTGCDWSLAPHPDVACSIGAALEKLSTRPIGEWGTLSAVAALTRAIRRAAVKRVGYSGVFLPVLEDAILAKRSAEGTFDVSKLLLYSSVCGAGLDTIPLPGDVTERAIAALLSDVATMAVVLNKPLSVRLMPVPGLKPGAMTQFDFPYLINSQPLALEGGGGAIRDRAVSFKA